MANSIGDVLGCPEMPRFLPKSTTFRVAPGLETCKNAWKSGAIQLSLPSLKKTGIASGTTRAVFAQGSGSNGQRTEHEPVSAARPPGPGGPIMYAHLLRRLTARRPGRRTKRPLAFEPLEGRQLMSLSPQFLVPSPHLNVAAFDTVRKAGSGTTSGGGVYLIYTFSTVSTTSHG
jgi:hypothetical protein